MLIKIAWRNIWRNKLRSIVVMFAIALGIWAGIFASSIANGLNKQRMDNVINSQVSHLQIHHPQFKDNFELNALIPAGAQVKEALEQEENMAAFSLRTMVTGMVASPVTGKGVMIKGVEPNAENGVIGLAENMVEGKYFEGVSRNPILMGKTLAEKLNVGPRKKVVLTFQDVEGEVVQANFKVVGVYKTIDARNDEMAVFVRRSDLNRLLGLSDNQYHEVAALVKNVEELENTVATLKQQFPAATSQSWKEIIPGLDAADQIAKRMNNLLLLILLAALSFGIVNTMLMTVLERIREFGMLMAVGMNKTKVFLMIMLETIFLMLTATPLGIFMAYATIGYFGKYGMDFSKYSEGFSKVGVMPIIYPFQTADYYPKVILLVIFCAFLAAIYPAFKAIRLNPAEAIRKI